MKPTSKAPTYLPIYTDLTFKFKLGKKTHTDSMTMKLPRLKRSIFKFKAHAKSSEIGTVNF